MENLFFSILTFTIFLNCESVPYTYKTTSVEKQESFDELMRKDTLDRKARAIAAVNQFLNDSPEDTVAAVLIENKSNCNIIFKISGQKIIPYPFQKMVKTFWFYQKVLMYFKVKFVIQIIDLQKIL